MYAELQTNIKLNMATGERALRIIAFNRKTDLYKNLQKRANITTLHNRRPQETAIMMLKAKNNLLPRSVQHSLITQLEA